MAPFTASIADLRSTLTERNAALRAKNPHLAGTLRAITGTESDRALEDIFVENYYHVASTMFCNQVRAVIQIGCYGLGIFTGSGVFLAIEDFIAALWRKIERSVVDIYKASIKPEAVAFNCSDFVMRTTTPKSQLISEIFGGAAAVCAERVEGNPVLTGLLGLVQTYCTGTFGVVLSTACGAPSLNSLLDNATPVSETPGHDVILGLARTYCEGKVRKAEEDTAARTNAGPRRAPKRNHRADAVPNDNDDDAVLPGAGPAPAGVPPRAGAMYADE